MRESFVFYDSFIEALDELDPETERQIYRAITHYALRDEEPQLSGIAKAVFALIKPQIDANNKRYEVGKKGGRPKTKKTNGFKNQKPTVLENEKKIKPNVNVNVNDNVNVNENDNVFSKEKTEKKIDKFSSPIFDEFLEAYKNVFKQNGYLTLSQRDKVIELYETIPDLKEKLPIVMERLKKLEFDNINFKPNLTWLLKSDNFCSLALGEYEKKSKCAADYLVFDEELANG